MDLGLLDRVAIVGNSSQGIGRETALCLAREGVNLTIVSDHEDELRQTERDISRVSSQHKVLAIPGEMLSSADVRRVVRGTHNRFGRIDILVNSIGQQPTKAPSLMDDQEWEEALQRNFLSVVRMCREVMPYMQQQQWGRIINPLSAPVGRSFKGRVVSISNPIALLGYSKMLAVELGAFNITVNSVLAGVIDTEPLTSFYEAAANDQGTSLSEIVKSDIPMHRMGKPGEMADLITFLASERSSYITGTTVPVDGGAVQFPI